MCGVQSPPPPPRLEILPKQQCLDLRHSHKHLKLSHPPLVRVPRVLKREGTLPLAIEHVDRR
jgi:hypothetical protein